MDAVLDGLLQRLAGQVGKVVVGQIFQLQLVGGALQTGGVGRGDHRVGQLPDFPDGVLERPVTVDHDLHVLTGLLEEPLLDRLHQPLAVPGEELHLLLRGLVGAQQAVFLIIATAVHRGVEDLVQAEDPLRSRRPEQPLGAGPGVDVAAQHVLGVGQNGPGIVGKDDLHLGPAALDQLLVVGHIVHPGEGVLFIAEEPAVLLQGEHVLIGVHPLLVYRIQADQVVAHLVGGVAELLRPFGDAPQADGKAVTAEDGEDHPHCAAPQLGLHVGGDIVHRGVVALGPGHNGLGHGHNVPVPEGKAVLLRGLQQGTGDDLHQIVSAADNGGADAPGNGTDHTAHKGTLLVLIAFAREKSHNNI